jgi:hypothetical protein
MIASDGPEAPHLSVVVVFHNMRREAARTLHSLTTGYQLGVVDSDYEVLAVDSGSHFPLDPEWVSSFGPQFRYMSVTPGNPAPCRALNSGVAAARGVLVMCNIDGARILSPGILRKTLDAFTAFDNPFVYTLGMHLGPDAQPYSVCEGYDQAAEDSLLETVPWREDGYNLFRVSSLAMSSRDGFFSELTESNCLALRKSEYRRIGGFDERFVSPGGGLVNLDFFNRAMAAPELQPVMLMGEATFHQVHGGVATNVPVAEHPWEAFAAEYCQIRGQVYGLVHRTPEYFGEVRPESAHLCRRRGL